MYPGTQKPESGSCSLSCFPVVRPRKINGRCRSPVSSLQTLSTDSTSHCRARRLPNSHGRPWTLIVSKQVACPNNLRLLACLSAIAWVLAHSWFFCPDLNSPWGFHLSSAPMNTCPYKNGDWRSRSCGNPFRSLEISGMFQGFMCCNAWSSPVRPNNI